MASARTGCWLQAWTWRLGSRLCSTRSVGLPLPHQVPPCPQAGGAGRGLWAGPPRKPGGSHVLPCLLSVLWSRPQVLNEVVIDRGPSSYLSNVDVYLDGHLITTVQGDGRWASGLPGGGAWGRCPSLTYSLSRRRDRLHPDGQHGVCGRRGGVHDPPQRARHHGHAHLPPLAVLSAHCGARGG